MRQRSVLANFKIILLKHSTFRYDNQPIFNRRAILELVSPVYSMLNKIRTKDVQKKLDARNKLRSYEEIKLLTFLSDVRILAVFCFMAILPPMNYDLIDDPKNMQHFTNFSNCCLKGSIFY
uniref:Uncharacterized protein n=1 Tax=Glossina pallidipes TaxID=7398 RepID=A0A1A9ZBV0_GLOPL